MFPKIGILIVFFGIVYEVNALFFSGSTIHQIYKHKGSYNIGYFLPQTLLSFLITHILDMIIKYVFLSERNNLEIKNQRAKDKAMD